MSALHFVGLITSEASGRLFPLCHVSRRATFLEEGGMLALGDKVGCALCFSLNPLSSFNFESEGFLVA